jgi:hypothetical protein
MLMMMMIMMRIVSPTCSRRERENTSAGDALHAIHFTQSKALKLRRYPELYAATSSCAKSGSTPQATSTYRILFRSCLPPKCLES